MNHDHHLRLKERNQHYFSRWAKNYDHFIFGWWMRYMQRKLLDSVELNDNTTVLDVGCGTGYLLLQLSSRIKKGKIVGVDISPEMLKEAQKKVKDGKNIKLYQSDVEELPFPDKTFDYVLSAEAFHHFPDPEKTLGEMRRVLKDNGTIGIADVSVPPHFIFNLLFTLEPGFVRMYSKQKMARLAQGTGLKMIQQKRVGVFALIHTFKRAYKR
jgi:ubiquinone/menaquinone biosynthesis C-methylase UbiE